MQRCLLLWLISFEHLLRVWYNFSMSPALEYYTALFGLDERTQPLFRAYVAALEQASGRQVIEEVVAKKMQQWENARVALELPTTASAEEWHAALRQRFLKVFPTVATALGKPSLKTSVGVQQMIDRLNAVLPSSVKKGFFLKYDVAQQLLQQHPPTELMTYFGYSTVDELLDHQEIREVYAALRFGVSAAWADGFIAQYTQLTPDDFEERSVEYIVLDPAKWFECARQFAEKKLHPCSHLKELGVVFAIPNPEALTDDHELTTVASLLSHYSFEVSFYSRFFHTTAQQHPEQFGPIILSLVRGGIVATDMPTNGVRIMHQYYLKKEHPDPRVYEPHVIPEPIHWEHARTVLHSLVCRDMDEQEHHQCALTFWEQKGTVAQRVGGAVVSLNFEDNLVSNAVHKTYHVTEALWNELCTAHWSTSALETALLQSLSSGVIPFSSLQ